MKDTHQANNEKILAATLTALDYLRVALDHAVEQSNEDAGKELVAAIRTVAMTVDVIHADAGFAQVKREFESGGACSTVEILKHFRQ